MVFWYGFQLITGIHLLAAISPGPDFIFVSQQTLSRGRTAGVICALGVSLGFGVYIWLGYQGIRAKANHEVVEIQKMEVVPQSHLKTLCKGFLCNVLNPKAPIYLVSVFTLVLSPEMPVQQLSAYGVWMIFLLFLWFATVAFLLSIPQINRQFQKAGHWIDRTLGGVMIALGIKVIAD